MKVKILKAEKPTYWYADRIGEVFEVDKLTHDYVLSEDRKDPAQMWRHIYPSDCEVITEPRQSLTEDPTGDSDLNYSDADNGL